MPRHKTRHRKTRHRKTRRRRAQRGGLNDPGKLAKQNAVKNTNNNPANLNMAAAAAAPAPAPAAAAPPAAANAALNINLQQNAAAANAAGQKTVRFLVRLKGPDYQMFLPEWQGIPLDAITQLNIYRVAAEEHSPEVAAQVEQWYREQVPDDEFVDIHHIEGSTYEITYTGEPDIELMIDPDDDGNYPLEIDGVEHLVQGMHPHQPL